MEYTIHPELPAVDIQRARAWYKATLGLDPVTVDGEPVPADADDDELLYDTGTATFGVYQSRHAGNNLATAARLVTDDFDAAHAELLANGVIFEEYPIEGNFDKDEHSMFTIHTRHVPSQRVMSIQRRLYGSETDAFVTEAKAAFAAQLDGLEPAGPFTLVFHGIVDADNDGPIEAMLGCSNEMQPTELIGVHTEPAHDEAYTIITKAQWGFPAILAAYDAVACSPESAARPGSPLSCREVYLAEPDEINNDEFICDIAFPLT